MCRSDEMEEVELEERIRILKEVFGDSSDDDHDKEEEEEDVSFEKPYKLRNPNSNPNSKWVKIKEINGLWFFKDFLSLQQQTSLLSAIKHGMQFYFFSIDFQYSQSFFRISYLCN